MSEAVFSILSPEHLLEVHDTDGALMASISYGGYVTLGDGYTSDAAARRFWNALAQAGVLTHKVVEDGLLQRAYDDGYNEGYNEGKAEGEL